jgi:prepilin-type N-terminal cleavage/methylation domain-containing protein
MTNRKAFTLIELMVAIGIMLVLATILLVAINHARRSAEITGEKYDFQAIEAALENYRSDFGSYPSNPQLTRWPPPNAGSPPPTAPQFLSLATALLGPGPGVPQNLSGQILVPGSGYETGVLVAGDGFDGPGIRTQSMNISATVSSDTITFNTPLTQAPIYTPGQSVWWFDQESIVNGVLTHTLFGIVNVTQPPTQSQATVTWGTSTGPNAATGVLRIATGKVWGPYLPTDRFQVAYEDPNRAGGEAADILTHIHQPLLLDRWGGMIQYFPSYGAMTNRINGSTYQTDFHTAYGLTTLPTNITVGPLFGFATPDSIDTTAPTNISVPYGSNSIFDQRDGAPVVYNLSPSNPAAATTITWQSGGSPDLTLAVKWMLGDDNLNNFLDGAETPRNPNPYILISTGPDGPNRNNGGYCDLSVLGSNPSTAQCAQAFQTSGNIYNFDR